MDDWRRPLINVPRPGYFLSCRAHLARGDDWTTAGPPLDVAKLVRLDIHSATIDAAGLHGKVLGVDGPFGNLVLNVPAKPCQAGLCARRLRTGDAGWQGLPLSFCENVQRRAGWRTFVLYRFAGRLSLGINQRNFSETYKLSPGTELLIPAKH